MSLEKWHSRIVWFAPLSLLILMFTIDYGNTEEPLPVIVVVLILMMQPLLMIYLLISALGSELWKAKPFLLIAVIIYLLLLAFVVIGMSHQIPNFN